MEERAVKKQWWKEKVVYQIYPKSFKDSNGDGIGDLKGILEKLPYLKNLGIDMVWLSPVYQSPFIDQGYDISDYYKISEVFGTMEDFDTLLAEAKKLGIGIVMDLVINHCSSEHEWFQKALKDPYGEYAGYFYFEKGKDGNPPSNYRSYFGGSAWEKVPGTDLYYLHMFAKEQPDLNWENPKVKKELFDMINWWLDKGIAGFRIDAIINIKKDVNFPSYEPDGPDGMCACTAMVERVDGIGELLGELKRETFAKRDTFTVGEVFNLKEGALEEFVGENGYFSSMFDFAPHMLTEGQNGWYDTREVTFLEWKKTIIQSQMECQEKAFLSNIIENHDEPRGASRYLPEYAQNPDGIKMLGCVSVLLRGIPFIYQGQEIGMTNCRMDSIEDYDDIDTYHQYREAREAGLSDKEALEACYRFSRDNARTPMQWDAGENAGFTKGMPWLRVNENYRMVNVADQEKDPGSVLHFYRKLIALRKSEEWKNVFVYGEFLPLFEEDESLFAYARTDGEKKAVILANFGKEEMTVKLSENLGKVLLANMYRPQQINAREVVLEPCEVVVCQVCE